MQQVQWVWPQEEHQVGRHSLFVLVLFSTRVHHLLECLGLTCYFIVLSMLPIPPHGVLKELPAFVTMHTLSRSHACTMDGLLNWLCVGQELPFSSPCLCTTFLNQQALALSPGFCIAVHLLPVLKTWCFEALPDCCHERRNVAPSFVPNNWSECLIKMLANVCAYTLPSLSS